MRVLIAAMMSWLVLIDVSQARPVSYPSGWTLMSANNSGMRSAHLHYSPSVSYSVGYKFEYWPKKQFSSQLLQVNHLAKRWNKKHSQANVYLKSGIGRSSLTNPQAGVDDDISRQSSGFFGLSADWEDRRYFIAYSNRYTVPSVVDDFFRQTARVGWAPYEGKYGDLHTWFMLQVLHKPELNNEIDTTALVRLFKGVHLVEAGIDNAGDFLINYIFRY